MLEHSTLLVHPWTRTSQPDGSTAWLRSITDDANHALGCVRHQKVAALSWLFWLKQTQLDVFETEDAAHLLKLTRSWSMTPLWDLRDAEERYVGRIFRNAVIGDGGQFLARIERDKFVDPANQVLATCRKQGDVVELVFMPMLDANPFLRMLMLGAVLARDPKPQRP